MLESWKKLHAVGEKKAQDYIQLLGKMYELTWQQLLPKKKRGTAFYIFKKFVKGLNLKMTITFTVEAGEMMLYITGKKKKWGLSLYKIIEN